MRTHGASDKGHGRKKSKKLKFHGDRSKFRAFREDLKSYLGTISKATHLLEYEATVSPDGSTVTFTRSLQSRFAIRAREVVEDDHDDDEIMHAMLGQTYLQVATGPISVEKVLQAAAAAEAGLQQAVQPNGAPPAAAAAAAEAQEEAQPVQPVREEVQQEDEKAPQGALAAAADAQHAQAVLQPAAARLAAYQALSADDKKQISLIRKNIRKEYRKKLRKLHDQIINANHEMYDEIRDACSAAVKKNVFVKDEVPSNHGMAAWEKLVQEYDLKTNGTAMIAKPTSGTSA